MVFYNYKIVGDVLYLYVDDKCEIGSFFGSGKDNLVDNVKDYIRNMKIKFSGTKVVLLISGLVLGCVYLNNTNVNTPSKDVYTGNKYVYNVVDKSIPQHNLVINTNDISNSVNEQGKEVIGGNDVKNSVTTNKGNVSSDGNNAITTPAKKPSNPVVNHGEGEVSTPPVNEMTITLRRSSGDLVNMGISEYLIGVVGAEMPASFNQEALKAQTVVARTYTLKLIESGRTLTDDVSTQAYKSNDELKRLWGSSYNTYYNKIKNAVSTTDGLCIKYNGRLIDAVYHSTSNGYTQDAVNVWGNNVPYLKSVTSPWDTSASSYLRDTTLSFDKISSILGMDFNSASLIEVISRDGSNRISKIKFNNKEYTGVQIRGFLGLRSADFDVSITNGGVVFTTRGYGHGVGMSQYGANGMANSGYSYEQIIKHYYTGVQIVKI